MVKDAANENEARTTHVHVFPVDPALTVAEAWDELCPMGVRATNTGPETWASIRCDGDECRNIAEETP